MDNMHVRHSCMIFLPDTVKHRFVQRLVVSKCKLGHCIFFFLVLRPSMKYCMTYRRTDSLYGMSYCLSTASVSCDLIVWQMLMRMHIHFLVLIRVILKGACSPVVEQPRSEDLPPLVMPGSTGPICDSIIPWKSNFPLIVPLCRYCILVWCSLTR